MDDDCGKVTSSSVSHFIPFVILVIFLIWTLARNALRASVLCKDLKAIVVNFGSVGHPPLLIKTCKVF